MSGALRKLDIILLGRGGSGGPAVRELGTRIISGNEPLDSLVWDAEPPTPGRTS